LKVISLCHSCTAYLSGVTNVFGYSSTSLKDVLLLLHFYAVYIQLLPSKQAAVETANDEVFHNAQERSARLYYRMCAVAGSPVSPTINIWT